MWKEEDICLKKERSDQVLKFIAQVGSLNVFKNI